MNSRRPTGSRPSRVCAGFLCICAWLTARGAAAHEVKPPKPLVQPAPAWPGGKPYAHDVVVPVLLTVTAEGAVSDVQIDASVGPDFDAVARDAARTWKFNPALSAGKPVPAKVRAIVRFVGDPLAAAKAVNESVTPAAAELVRAQPPVV